MADSSSLVQAPDGPRILFVGVGTFIMIVVLIVAVLIAIAGRGTRMPIVFYAAALGLVGVFLLFLLLAPREPAFTSPDDEQRLTSNYSLGLGLMATLALLASAGGVAGAFLYGCMDKVTAVVIDDDMSAYR